MMTSTMEPRYTSLLLVHILCLLLGSIRISEARSTSAHKSYDKFDNYPLHAGIENAREISLRSAAPVQLYASVPEESPIGTEVITVNPSAPGDNTRYSFSPESGHLDLFRIDPTNGRIYVAGRLDWDTQMIPFYTVVVLGEELDNGGQVTRYVLQISVEDINDHAPEITINTMTGNEGAEVVENSAIATFVAIVTAHDEDLGHVSCSVDSEDFRLEATRPSTYVLATAVVLDREAVDMYDIEVTCRDSGEPPLTSSVVLHMTVLDVNDYHPECLTDEVHFEVLEGGPPGTLLGTVNAFDRDTGRNGVVKYSLNDGLGIFHIDEDTGKLRATSVLDHEAMQEITLEVMARDLGQPQQSATCTVTITVLDINDNTPQFDQPQYVFSIMENSGANQIVGIVSARDADSAPYGTVQYSLVGETENDQFSIGAETGVLRTTRSLDRELTSQVSFYVRASDGFLIADKRITVHIGDENDNAPRLVYPINEDRRVTVSMANITMTDPIMQFLADDADAGINAELVYSLVCGSTDDFLRVNRDTGEVYLRGYHALMALYPGKEVHCAITVKDKAPHPLHAIGFVSITFNE